MYVKNHQNTFQILTLSRSPPLRSTLRHLNVPSGSVGENETGQDYLILLVFGS